MSNRLIEMQQIRLLVANWMSLIRLNNYESYLDINKVSEHLCRQLVNLLYDYEMIDLNQPDPNFPGLDIGDKTKSMIAFQVTSRIDVDKIISGLKMVAKKNYHNIFTKGIRFLILNDTGKVPFTDKTQKPENTLPTFKVATDIVYPSDLIKQIEFHYEENIVMFYKIKELLNKEFTPRTETAPAKIDMGALQAMMEKLLETKVDHEQTEVNVSASYFTGDIVVPAIHIVSKRSLLVNKLYEIIEQKKILWLKGSPSIGKTSLAVLLSKKVSGAVLWIECRDTSIEQLAEQIITLLGRFYKISPNFFYTQVIEEIMAKAEPGTLIIFNDLPDLNESIIFQQQLGQLYSAAAANDISILVTSNYVFPYDFADKFGLVIESSMASPFTEEDTKLLFKHFGADKETAELFSGLVTKTTEGHPLLIHSAGKYLSEKGWEVDNESITAIFACKFGAVSQTESYARVLEHTSNEETRQLLYRLRFVVGGFTIETVQLIAAVEPVISNPAEKINYLKNVWLQEDGSGNYQLSPLIKILDGNVGSETRKEIFRLLGKNIIGRKNISQMDASTAIYYFSMAGENNHAIFILFRVLSEFSKQPQLFFDWGFDMYWFSQPLPDNVAPFFKVQVRILQASICIALKKDITFLIQDLKNIAAKEDIGLLGTAMSNMFFFYSNVTTQPLSALQQLAIAQSAFNKLEDTPFGLESNLFNENLLNGIWLVFSLIHTKKDYEAWFSITQEMVIPSAITDAYHNSIYAMAGGSIYRNAAMKNLGKGEDIIALLEWLITQNSKHNFQLLSVFALNSLCSYISFDIKDFEKAVKLEAKYKEIWAADPLYKFLFFTELGKRHFYAGKIQEANTYLDSVKDFIPPVFYIEYLDYLITYMQVSHKINPEFSPSISAMALEVSLSGPYYTVEDKIKLYGEAAIGASTEGRFLDALNLYEKGYELLLNNFKDNEDYHAIVIRYGNAVKYVTEHFEKVDASDFGEGKYIIPTPGYFYMNNETLLANGYYFKERNFIVAIAVQHAFEAANNLAIAKKWAYKSIEISVSIPEPHFTPVLQPTLFYLAEDGEYRHAYQVLAYIDTFYNNLKQKIKRGENVEEELKNQLSIIKDNDTSLYYFMILPMAFSFSLGIVEKTIDIANYQDLIDKAFQNESYIVQHPDSFMFAKRLFESIIIKGITEQEMQKMIREHGNEYESIFYYIGAILSSSFVDASKAMELHLLVVNNLDSLMRRMLSVYRFCIVPYFEKFWKQKLLNSGSQFDTKEHLKTKGFSLIDKTTLDKKIQTILRVFANHLSLLDTSVNDFNEVG